MTTAIQGRTGPALQTGMKAAPTLPVADALRPLLPQGIRRGSTVAVEGSLSLLFALLGAASGEGAWCALIGFPRLSAEALHEYGVALERCALVPRPGTQWTTAVGALLDAVDLVAVRPPARLSPGEVRRLAGRARSKASVLVPYGAWEGADARLSAGAGAWNAPPGDPDGGEPGAGGGPVAAGRLRARRMEVRAQGRGTYAQPRRATLWLPARGGGVCLDNVVGMTA